MVHKTNQVQRKRKAEYIGEWGQSIVLHYSLNGPRGFWLTRNNVARGELLTVGEWKVVETQKDESNIGKKVHGLGQTLELYSSSSSSSSSSSLRASSADITANKTPTTHTSTVLADFFTGLGLPLIAMYSPFCLAARTLSCSAWSS